MLKLIFILICAIYVSAGGLYSNLDTYGYGSGYNNGYGYGLGGYGLGHPGPVISYAPYATSYANTYKTTYPVIYSSYYPSVKKIHYANPLYKLGYYSPTYLGGYAASYSPYSSYSYGLNNYDYDLGHGYDGYSGYGGYRSFRIINPYGTNVYNHY